MNTKNNFELRKFENDIDSVHLMPCKKGVFSKSLGKFLPDQLIGQINNYQQNNYYGYDLFEVIEGVSELLNKMQCNQDEIQYQNFIKSLKRFKTSGKNIEQLFDDASKISTLNIFNLVDENLYKNGLNEDFLDYCNRLIFILYVYLFSSILIEGINIKNEEEIRDDIDKLLSYLLNIYENFLFDKMSKNNSSLISESFYAKILTDKNCNTALIGIFAEIDRRFYNGYEVINKIIEERTKASNIDHNRGPGKNLKLYLSELTYAKDNEIYNYDILDNILKLRDVIIDLQKLKSMRDSFNHIDDIIVDKYHQSLLLDLFHKSKNDLLFG